MTSKPHFFFNGLNELRAIAAFAVVIHHIEFIKHDNALPSLCDTIKFFIGNLGQNGVFLFFVLSGFLITYLLLLEKQKNDTIFLKKFYLRRIFRIWPLYYLVFGISVLLLPFLTQHFFIFRDNPVAYNTVTTLHNYGIKGILFYIFFCPYVALYSGYYIWGCSQAWSVGVEEQFYILWPLLLLLFSRRKIIWVFVSVLIIAPLMIYLAKGGDIIYPFSVIIKCLPFHYMAIGAIGAYIFFNKKDAVKKYTQSKILYVLLLTLILVFMSFSIFVDYIQNIMTSFLFLGLIVISINDANPIVFRNGIFSYIGKISYGIYMYHNLVLFFVVPVINHYFSYDRGSFLYNVLLYLSTFGVTVAISSASYYYFESRFIKIKDTRYKAI